MAVKYFNHVTLTTGHTLRVYPDQIDKSLYFRIQSIVKDAVQPDGVEVYPNITLRMTKMREGYVATFFLTDEDCPILSTGAALNEAPDLWRLMHMTTVFPVKTRIDAPTPTPYILDRLEVPNPRAAEFFTVSAKWCQHLAWVVLAPEQVYPVVGSKNGPSPAQETCPPASFLKWLNRMWPDAWRQLRIWFSDYRTVCPVPAWCTMPVFFPMTAYLQNHDMVQLQANKGWLICVASMYLWRLSKGVYRFAPELFEALTQQPLEGDLQNDLFHRLPEWAVYIETPGLYFDGAPMSGFIAHLDYNLESQATDLQFLIFQPDKTQPRPIALPLGEGNVQDAIDRLAAYDAAHLAPNVRAAAKVPSEQVKREFSSMLQLLIYLCCDNRDLPPIRHPRERMRLSGAVDAPKEPRVWEVGERVAAAIRQYDPNKPAASQSRGTHASPRPHIRRAHYHTFLTGPKTGERGRVIHWIPPLPVGVKWDEDKQMPIVIHPIDP